jgi:SAM-dependent methyltransferase
MDFVSQEYWDSSYDSFQYFIENDDVTRWIDAYINKISIGSLFEFGCYPGRYIAFLGKKGWVVSGMDLTPRIETDFLSWLHKENIKTGIIKKGDALAYARTTADKYDLVCSFGFIEHFENFIEIIQLHDSLLKNDGYLMISTPNFRGFIQRILHITLDRKNLNRHYLPSMQPILWKQELEKHGYKVLFSGYFGNFDFWYDEQSRSKLQKTTLKLIRKLKPFLKWIPNASFYSPYCGIIAQKNK